MPALDLPLARTALSTFTALPCGPFGYVGPGAGLEFLGHALALLLYALTALSAVLLWPVYVLLRRLRGRKDGSAPASPAEEVAEGASGEDRPRP